MTATTTTQRGLWTERPMLVFFAIAFGLPWAGWTTLAILGQDKIDPVLKWALFYTGDFCSVGGIVALYAARGWPGVKQLGWRSIDPRHPIGWWAYALFLPVLVGLIATAVYLASHGGIGSFKPLALFGLFAPMRLIWFTTGPLGEEAGWRGFLLPRLLTRYSPRAASVILGLIWSAWHYPLYYNQVFATLAGGFRFTASVICSSILITALFLHTRAGVLLPIILHWTWNMAPGVAHAILGAGDDLPGYNWFELGTYAVVTVLIVFATPWGRPFRSRSNMATG